MKKSIRIAAALCAAVFLAGALAGCNSDDDEENGGGSGGKVENRFAGKTIEYEDTDREEYDGHWYEDYEYTKITFTKDTARFYSKWRSTSSYSEEVREEIDEAEYTYVLESVNGKNVLHLTEKNPKYHFYDDKDERQDCTFDEYVSAYYNGISSDTKELLRKTRSSFYAYYEFTDNNTVKLYNNYYVGDMTKSSDSFRYNGYNSASSDEYDNVSFGQSRLRLRHYSHNDSVEYWGIPRFNGKTFTAEMYRVEYQSESRNDKYIKVGTVEGNYAINGTGAKCTGTVSFTKFPNDEMKNLFKNSYQVQNYDSDGDGKDEEPDYTEYTIKN